jgi:hypothetical protein
VPPQRLQERVKVIAACHVIATAIDEHIEGLPDFAHLRHVSSDEANASCGGVTGRPSPGFLDRSSGEIHPDYMKSVRCQQERLDATPTAKVERSSARR